jgi:hypothetical protein
MVSKMETKEYKLPPEEEQLSSEAELLAGGDSVPAVKPPRSPSARVRARRNALLDAAVGLGQQLLLCPALAVCVCMRGRLALSLEFAAAAVLIAAVDFFFGGFLPRKYRALCTGLLHAVSCCVFAWIHSGFFSALAALLLGALAQAALCASNARLALSGSPSPRLAPALRVQAAAVLALALCAMGTLV